MAGAAATFDEAPTAGGPMIIGIIIGIGVVTLWAAALSWYRSYVRSRTPLPTPKVRTLLEAGRLVETNPETAWRLVEPLVDATLSEGAVLRARADRDPVAAAQLHVTLHAVVTHVEQELRKVQGRDAEATAQLTRQLATLRDEVALVQAASAPVGIAIPKAVVLVGQRTRLGERQMKPWYRVGAAVIGSLCLAFGIVAVAALVRGARHPAIFLAAFMMLLAATDFLLTAFNAKGHRPSLMWFFP